MKLLDSAKFNCCKLNSAGQKNVIPKIDKKGISKYRKTFGIILSKISFTTVDKNPLITPQDIPNPLSRLAISYCVVPWTSPTYTFNIEPRIMLIHFNCELFSSCLKHLAFRLRKLLIKCVQITISFYALKPQTSHSTKFSQSSKLKVQSDFFVACYESNQLLAW